MSIRTILEITLSGIEFKQAAIPPSRSSVASGKNFIEVIKQSFDQSLAIEAAVDTETDAQALRKALRRDAGRAGLGLDTEIRPPAEGDEENGKFVVVFQARPIRPKRSNGVTADEDGSPDNDTVSENPEN